MNNRTIYIVSGCIILGIAIIIALTYIILISNVSANDSFLRVNVNDITLNKGEVIENFYTPSKEDEIVEFEVDKENIINITETKIEAISVGQVNVVITVKAGESIAKDNFTVTVVNNEYSFDINCILDCTYDDNTLYITSNMCMFGLSVYDIYGNKMEEEISYKLIGSGLLQKEMGRFCLVCDENCTIVIAMDKIDFEINLSVVIV